ncbi:PAS domain-containing protein [Phenylobacterium aquaticum]|uniref:PAS domain-containing protein n=1 Tax=Phenylobacterium aquaticum TaxID=1763816 RepID=UPI001F5D5B46|nr:PAS domain-containing protein [Phenylobacterium aquaticum]MCI3134003.1 PAS domain-containing protein [Phenylobacterium aquaticum]
MPTPSAPDRDETAWDGAMLRALAEASQDCLWVLSPEGEVRYMNPRARALLNPAPKTRPTLRALWPEESRFSLDRAVAAAARARCSSSAPSSAAATRPAPIGRR